MISSKLHPAASRGFTLLTAIILSSVILAIGIALLDVAYKQTILASSAKNSQYAFYAADSGMECALYWDQKQDAFDYGGLPFPVIDCAGQTISLSNTLVSQATQTRFVDFEIPCPGGGTQAHVVITKTVAAATSIFSTGYSSCSTSDPRRIERGLKMNY